MLESQIIKCPKCDTEISVNEVLRHQITAEIAQQYEQQKDKDQAALTAEKAALTRQLTALAQQKAEIEALKQDAEQQVNNQVKAKLAEREQSLRRQLKQEVTSEQKQLLDLLKTQLAEKNTKLQEAAKQEVEFLKQKSALEEKQRNLELENLQQIEAAKDAIRAEEAQKAAEAFQLKLAQKDKQLADAVKQAEELKRKAEQGSQQAQGEVLEATLKDTLERAFDRDDIQDVPTGIRGADIVQKVHNAAGKLCGQIIWEAKNTKAWQGDWIQKLKDDQRALGADIAILVSTVLPKGIISFAPVDGIWVCDWRYALPLAALLRDKLEAITRERNLAVGKNEKMEILYAYLTGTQFRQKMEAIVENFSAMKTHLAKERLRYIKESAKMEKQLESVLITTASMYGDLDAMVALPKIPALELEFSGSDEAE